MRNIPDGKVRSLVEKHLNALIADVQLELGVRSGDVWRGFSGAGEWDDFVTELTKRMEGYVAAERLYADK